MPAEPAATRFIERMGGVLADAGLARLPARVFAALVVDDDGRMTAAELADTLGVSPAGVSGAVKTLTQISFVHRERERGSRRDVYVVDDDVWIHAMMQESRTYAPMQTALTSALDDLGDAPSRRRLLMMLEFLRFMEEEMVSLATRWDERRRRVEAELGSR